MIRRVLLALGVGVVLLGCAAKDTVEPPAELVSFERAFDVRTVWKQKVGSGSERLRLGLAPASDGNRVYAGALDGTISAIGLTDGETVWSVDTGMSLAAGPGVGAGLVIFGTREGSLIALDADTGEMRWEHDVDSEVLAAPAVAEDRIVYRSVDGRLSTMPLDGGADIWSNQQTMPALTLRGNTAPIVIGDQIIAGFNNGRVGSYSLDEGVPRWEIALSSPAGRSEIDRLVDVGVAIAVFGNDVYAANFQGTAAAVDLLTGVVLWQHELSSFTGLGVDTQQVYVTDDVSAVIALSRLNGSEVWRQEGLRLRDVTSATRYGDSVVVADFEGFLHWLSAADGHFLARVRAASSQIWAQPLAVGPLVVVQSEDGTVAAFEIADESD
jgi:outer membrane protein assembly factor BamB